MSLDRLDPRYLGNVGKMSDEPPRDSFRRRLGSDPEASMRGSALCIVGKLDRIGGREVYRARRRPTERTGPLAPRAQA